MDFRLDKEPKYSIKECKERDVTYAAPLRVTARLLNKETGEVKDQEIFMEMCIRDRLSVPKSWLPRILMCVPTVSATSPFLPRCV